jgi:glutamine amidotransferase
MVAIIDYGMGNLISVKKALDYLKVDNIITAEHKSIADARSLILPGVGSFQQGMLNLKERGLIEVLNEEVLVRGKNFLGICLGMQLLFEVGYEPVQNEGLGWLKGSVEKLKVNLPVPHIGWNNLTVRNCSFYDGIKDYNFYFIHSYHVVPNDNQDIVATTEYGSEIIASVKHHNIFATQFHPEKSQDSGLKLLENYFKDAKG